MRLLLQYFSWVVCGVILASCALNPVLHPMLDGYPGTVTHSDISASFCIPQQWGTRNSKERNDGRYVLAPRNRSGGIMVALFGRLNPTKPATQIGQVEGYLYAVHHHSDDAVHLEAVGTTLNPRQGSIGLYHLYSDYFGQRLYAEIIHGPLSFSLELQCRTAEELVHGRPAFEAVLQSVNFKGDR